MKNSYLGALLIFVLTVSAIALLSSPRETTWIAMYLDNQKLRHAEALLQKRYQKNPEDLETAAKLVETLEALEENRRAKEIVLEVLRHNPDSIPWKRRLALTLLAENDPVAAAGILAPHERDREFWLILARGYHDISLNELAEQALFARHEDDEDQAEAWRTLALWRAERGDTQGEKDALEEALRQVPEDGELIARYFRNRARARDLPSTLWAAERLPRPLDREYLESLYELHREHGDYAAAQANLEQLLAREDARVADALAMVSILYQQNKLAQAQAVLEKLAAGASAFSPDEKSAYISQTHAVHFALLQDAAQKGAEAPILQEIANLRAQSVPPASETLRGTIYACLKLSDFFGQLALREREKQNGEHPGIVAEKRAQFWLNQAKELFAETRELMPLSELANARLTADLMERCGDWRTMLKAWHAISTGQGPDAQTLLGIARASQHLRDYETSWRSLCEAEALAKDDADLLALALQAQQVASSLPVDHPQRAQKQLYADTLARKSLARNWNDTLALNLFFRALETKKLREAQDLLQSMASRGLATPHEYLGLAEAQVAMNTRREQATINALKALEANAPDTYSRLLYVFTALNNKQHVRTVLKRMERAGLSETPETLFQLAGAYSFLGDQKRQSELLEKRARLTGKLADWKDAIDNRYWNGDYLGALRLLDVAEANHPQDAELLGRRVLALADMSRHRQVIKVFNAARRREPDISGRMPAESLAALALAYDRNGQPERARHFFDLSLAKDPENNRAAFGLAELSRRQGKNRTATRLLTELTERNPENLWARIELANLHPTGQKNQYEGIIASVPKDADDGEKAALALALWRTGRLRDALKIYSELIQKGNRTPSILSDYAQALLDAGKSAQAKKILHESMRLHPAHIPSKTILASIFIHEKEYARAEACLRQALVMAPRDAEILRALAHIQHVREKSWASQKSWREAGRR